MKYQYCTITVVLWYLSNVNFQSSGFVAQNTGVDWRRHAPLLSYSTEVHRILLASNHTLGASYEDVPTRRTFVRSTFSAGTVSLVFTTPSQALAAVPELSSELVNLQASSVPPLPRSTANSITMPLIATGQELLISYKVDDSRFRAVLDTGSPFLMVPGSCGRNTQQKSGCYRNQGRSTGLETTIEIFDGFEGEVEWRRGTFAFVNATDEGGRPGTMLSLLKGDENDVIFGVASEEIMGGPGGVFFGMIKNTDARIRPSFLGQTEVQSFQVDLKSRPRTLTLSNEAMIDTSSTAYIPMTNLLRRRYGDPVGHYTARANSISVNGYPLLEKSSSIFVIFDTGVTGMIVSRELFNEHYANARRLKQKSLFGNVTLTFDTLGGGSAEAEKAATLTAIKPIATPFDPEKQWKRFPKSSHIIVLGLAFLEDRVMTVDIDRERIAVS